jgi:pantoate--beta-alanine ligase
VESSAGRGLSSPREVKFPGRGLSSPREVKFPGRGLSSPRKVEIIGIPTIREPDGMAMSSRNRFLSREDRSRVAMIFRALCESHAASTPEGAERIMRRVLAEASIEPEYAVVRDACTLMPVEFSTTDDRPAGRLSHSQPAFRALIAARVGSVRLIDNSDWGGGLCSSAWSSRGVMS